MTERTCAACDSPLDDNVIRVRLGGRDVEVCCEECAVKLKEAYLFAAVPDDGKHAAQARDPDARLVARDLRG